MTDMYSMSVDLRALAHILHYSGYIQQITHDEEFYEGLLSLTSDYLYYLANDSGESFKVTDKEECENRGKIKELQQEVKRLSAKLAELNLEEPEEEPEQEQEDE